MRLFEFLPWRDPPPVPWAKIDLGNGEFLEAEDVLEGHFHRIAATTVPVK